MLLKEGLKRFPNVENSVFNDKKRLNLPSIQEIQKAFCH